MLPERVSFPRLSVHRMQAEEHLFDADLDAL
jgi:hypothetical protein